MRQCPNCQEPNPVSARFCQSCGTKLETQETLEVRKLASIVFCDVTGSTALGEKLDPEVLRRLITRYFEDMRGVLERHGGTVEKFIGDAVMAVFGVPVVHEDDAVRAVRAAYEMRELVKQIVTPGTNEAGALQVRIGVNTGEVIAGDSSAGHGFVSGDTVNVAARFEQAAAPGQILIGESTYRLASHAIEADVVPPLELKGKSEPMRAYELLAIKSPSAGDLQRATKMVGRETELALLLDAFDEVTRTGTSKWMTVIGDAGAGKTALVQSFERQRPEQGRILKGRCLSYGEGITFWPIAEMVKEAAGITELGDSREEARAKLQELVAGASDVDLIVPRLSSALGLADEVAGAQEVMWAVRALLEHLSAAQPIALVIEDIHWAEPTLLDMVEYLATFMVSAPVLILTVGRSELMEKRPEWLARTTMVPVKPLAADAAKELVHEILGGSALPPQAERRVLESGQGNPLYIQEMLKMLLEQRLIALVEGHWEATVDLQDFEVPRTIQALLAARLERLPYEERAIVQHGSVVGKHFWFGAVAALTTDELRQEIGSSLQSLVRKDLLEPESSQLVGEDSFRFEQTLMRDAAYNALPKERRAELHEKVAAWLTSRAGDRIREYEDVLGYHLEQAALLRRGIGITNDETDRLAVQAGEALGRSGRRALASGDLPAAIGLLRRAIVLLGEDSGQGAELGLDLSIALAEGGELKPAGEVAARVLDVSRALGDERLTARAKLQTSTVRSMTDYDGWMETAGTELPGLLEELAILGDELGQVRALQLLADYHWDNLRTAQAQEFLDKALPMARRIEDRVEEGKIESFLAAVAFWGPMSVDEGIVLCNSIRESRPDDRLLQAKCMRSLSGLYAMAGDFEQARAMAAASRSLHLELGQLLSLAHSTQYFGLVEVLAGNPEAAVAELREGFDALKAMGEEAFLSTQAAMLARALFSAGRADEAYEMTVISEEVADDSETTLATAEWGPTRIRVLAERGELVEAGRLAEAVIAAAQKVENVIDLGNCYTAIAELFLTANQLERARSFLADALRVYETKGVRPLTERLRGLIAQIEVA